MNEKKHLTIRDLARLAGVSIATISRSLNNSPLVQEGTKQKILKLADDVGFETNASAKGLATSRVETIGIILPPEYDQFELQLYYGSLMDDLRESLERSNYDLIVSFATNRFTHKSNILRLINRKKVDGLIILREALEQEILNFLEKKHVPYIFSHYPPTTEDFTFDAVYTDHFWGGRLAGEHLVALGCQRIMYLSVENRAYEFVLREKGFCNALASHGIYLAEEDRLYSALTLEAGYRVAKEHAEKLSNTEALFAVTDLLAFGAIQALKEIGLHIPKDISVIGYDDIPLSAALKPTLTTIHQPREEIAQKTCQRLIEKIREGKNSSVKLREAIRPSLVVRESCGADLRKNKKDFFLDKTRNKK